MINISSNQKSSFFLAVASGVTLTVGVALGILGIAPILSHSTFSTRHIILLVSGSILFETSLVVAGIAIVYLFKNRKDYLKLLFEYLNSPEKTLSTKDLKKCFALLKNNLNTQGFYDFFKVNPEAFVKLYSDREGIQLKLEYICNFLTEDNAYQLFSKLLDLFNRSPPEFDGTSDLLYMCLNRINEHNFALNGKVIKALKSAVLIALEKALAEKKNDPSNEIFKSQEKRQKEWDKFIGQLVLYEKNANLIIEILSKIDAREKKIPDQLNFPQSYNDDSDILIDCDRPTILHLAIRNINDEVYFQLKEKYDNLTKLKVEITRKFLLQIVPSKDHSQVSRLKYSSPQFYRLTAEELKARLEALRKIDTQATETLIAPIINLDY